MTGATHHHNGHHDRARVAYQALRGTSNVLQSLLHQPMGSVKLSPSQFAVLDTLNRHDSMSQRELADQVGRSSGNMTVVVDNLERRQLVERRPTLEDRRVVKVCLTDKGAAIIRDVQPEHAKRLRNIFGTLSEGEIDAFVEVCEKLSESANNHRISG